ncbi:MAG: PIN domain-containing protein [Paraprevotella sp.]|jgi:pilT domain-containing protein|nr:PIN domain-containing protein [Paraprevotella sp.]MBP3472925.1 PIN domain-containing protein [Paraprevotella sp.]
MKVFLDTNVVIDFYAKREDFFLPASIIIDLAYRGEITLYVSSLTFVNAYYILGRTYKIDDLEQKLDALAVLCHITAVDEEVIRKAFSGKGVDFEDMVQYESAMTISPDVIVTRNIKHFSGLLIKALSPVDFLDGFLG